MELVLNSLKKLLTDLGQNFTFVRMAVKPLCADPHMEGFKKLLKVHALRIHFTASVSMYTIFLKKSGSLEKHVILMIPYPCNM